MPSSANHFLSDRIKSIGSSGIRRIFDLGSQLKDPIDLSLGQPDFEVPANIKRAITRAVESNKNGYTPTRGLPELRKRIAEQLKAEFGWSPDLFVTCGVSGGILLAMFACLNPGDEVLITDPYFVSYAHLPKLSGGVPVPVSLYDDFQLHPERIAAAITPRTKMIIIASPSNPTGVVFRESDVRAICELARKHDLLIIADEIYDLLHFDAPIPSPVKFAPERTLLLRGFGKSYALTGVRLGFAAGPSEIIEEMAKLQQYTFVCAPQPGQWGALEALDTDISQQVNDYRRKRDLACEELRGCLEFVKPSGAFYLFPKVPKRYKNSTEFVAAAIERKLLVIPGEVFSRQDTHFRLSFGVPDDRLRRGCAIIRELAT
ncbi:MAG: aminotransferase class I/II-fold pyridoxal phosphate-dependent enzyme [Planctomycetes bacterium]|nr:aminotransferase class I/II-fold pyridoxal phosphate-dependent enzyme [Planctomycetota bacterium]MBI3834450.1 aminotransferase class I/II-fold pyridoxal phosphate-dependent enzyme [Planctomycetota bacterium]